MDSSDPELLLEHDVRALATPEGQMTGTAGHRAARAFLERRLANAGLEPYEGASFALPYRVSGTELASLVGVAAGRDRELDPILIGAHYDTAGPYPGADDNAAAVAIALAVAERLTANAADRDVVVALFDAEEPPWFHTPSMGSTWFRTHQQRGRMHAALIMDLVGHAVPIPGAEDVLFVTGVESDPGLQQTILERPRLDDLRVVTALNRYVGDMSARPRSSRSLGALGGWRHNGNGPATHARRAGPHRGRARNTVGLAAGHRPHGRHGAATISGVKPGEPTAKTPSRYDAQDTLACRQRPVRFGPCPILPHPP